MKYFRITCKTPYCGEEADYYFATEDMEALESFVADAIADNAMSWFDEDNNENEDWDNYFAECYADTEEIDEKTYRWEALGEC